MSCSSAGKPNPHEHLVQELLLGALASFHKDPSWWVPRQRFTGNSAGGLTKLCFSEKPSWWVLRPCITVSPAGGCQSPALWGARLVDTWVLLHRDRSLSLTLQGTQLMGAWTPLHREPDWRRPKACFIRSPVGCCLGTASQRALLLCSFTRRPAGGCQGPASQGSRLEYAFTRSPVRVPMPSITWSPADGCLSPTSHGAS